MPLSVRLPAMQVATSQCTFATSAPPGGSAAQIRVAGTTPFALRTPSSGTPARVEIGQMIAGSAAPSGGSVMEFCLADGLEHGQILSAVDDMMTWIRANNPNTDQMGAPEMLRGFRIIRDFVRQNTIKT